MANVHSTFSSTAADGSASTGVRLSLSGQAKYFNMRCDQKAYFSFETTGVTTASGWPLTTSDQIIDMRVDHPDYIYLFTTADGTVNILEVF